MDKTAKWTALENEIIQCRRCPRLVEWREEVARVKRRAFRNWGYWAKPVPGFGDLKAKVLIVGLAPGAHGSNRTGRMFTGDASGEFLYSALHKEGFANQPTSQSCEDGLSLNHLFITAVVRCVPPGNKPIKSEFDNCREYWLREMELLKPIQGIVCLGQIAFSEVLPLLKSKTPIKQYSFSHGAFYQFGDDKPWVLTSYHPSRQNTQTGRLTVAMFASIWSTVHRLIQSG
jgi:uracil-DNA glycosylase